jgi:TonB family protein
MRKPLVVLLAIGAFAGSLCAQDSVKREVKLANGTVISRKCAEWKSEGILILPAGAYEPGAAGLAYFTRLAAIMERRMVHVAVDSAVLVASFAARVLRSGATVDVRLLRGSGRGGFDMDAQRVATLPPGDPMIEPTPASMPDSFPIFLSFGRKRDGGPDLVSHLACPAAPYPTNPKPEYPIAQTLSRTRNVVRAKFTVDTMGVVDTAGVVILEETTDAFEQAALDYLAHLKFLPMEFDGRKEQQVITRSIVFEPPIQEGSD